MQVQGGAGGGTVFGHNPKEIEGLGSPIKTAADATEKAIVEEIKNGIVIPISTVWYAPEAVRYFKDLKEDVRNQGTIIKDAYDKFCENLENIGNNWAENTEYKGTINIKRVPDFKLDLDVSSIKDQENNNIYLDTSAVENIANSLSNVEQTIKQELSSIASNLDASAAFIGGGQSDAIKELFQTINTAVANIFKFLADDSETSVKVNLNKARKKYEEVARAVASGAQATAQSISQGGFSNTGS